MVSSPGMAYAPLFFHDSFALSEDLIDFLPRGAEAISYV